MKKSSLIFGVMRVPLDALLTLLAFLLAYELRLREIFPFEWLGVQLGGGALDPWADYLRFAGWATLGLLVLFALSGFYDLRAQFRPFRSLIRIATAVSAWMMLIIAFFFLTRELFFSRAVMAYTWILVIVLVFLGRLFLSIMEKVATHFARERIKVLFIGAGEINSRIAHELQKDPRYEVLGSLVVKNSERKNAKLKVLGSLSDLQKIVRKNQVDEIFQLTGQLSKKQLGVILAICRENQIEFRFLPSILEIYSKNVEIETLDGLPIVFLRPSRLDGWGRVLKRGFDVTGALGGLIIFSPLLLVTALGVLFTSRGPIFYRDFRAGKNKQKFVCYKFRSMYTDMCSGDIDGTKKGNETWKKLVGSAENLRAGTPMTKIKNDPRVTPWGRFIRKTSLDELPQFWNVLKGDMSLVGPRPHMLKEVANYKNWHNRVFAIKPGITGMAQISGRSDLEFDEEVRLDVAYIENWSLMMDIAILIKTVGVVLGRGHEN